MKSSFITSGPNPFALLNFLKKVNVDYSLQTNTDFPSNVRTGIQ